MSHFINTSTPRFSGVHGRVYNHNHNHFSRLLVYLFADKKPLKRLGLP